MPKGNADRKRWGSISPRNVWQEPISFSPVLLRRKQMADRRQVDESNRAGIGGVEKTDLSGRVVGMSPKSDREMLYKPKNKGQR